MGILSDLRDDSVSKEMAKSGGIGLGQMLYETLSKKAQVSSLNADKLGERRNSP
jgi:Rod binding domain-containing protein